MYLKRECLKKNPRQRDPLEIHQSFQNEHILLTEVDVDLIILAHTGLHSNRINGEHADLLVFNQIVGRIEREARPLSGIESLGLNDLLHMSAAQEHYLAYHMYRANLSEKILSGRIFSSFFHLNDMCLSLKGFQGKRLDPFSLFRSEERRVE